MEESMNCITLTGRLGRDPELHQAKSGTTWATVSVADGGDDPNWFDVKCFNRTAEILDEYGSKGRKVAIQGRMAQERYEKDGEPRVTWRLIANRIEFLDSPDGYEEPEASEDPPI
jgi:single-strand DNA-binding protein